MMTIAALAQMYGEQTVNQGIEIVEGRTVFHGLHTPGLSLQGFDRHQALLAGYEKLQRAKQRFWQKVD